MLYLSLEEEEEFVSFPLKCTPTRKQVMVSVQEIVNEKGICTIITGQQSLCSQVIVTAQV